MVDPFTRAFDLNSQYAPNYELPSLGFTDTLGIGASEAQPSISMNIFDNIMLPYSGSEQLDETTWKSSAFYREGLRYEPNMNRDWAQSLAETYDNNIEFSKLHDRMSFGGEVGSFVGGMGASLLDPVNFIALPAGVGLSLAKATGSKVLGAMLYGAATNAAVETGLAPFRSIQADTLQTEYGFSNFAYDVGISGALGGVLGGLGGALASLKARRKAKGATLAQGADTGLDSADTAPTEATDTPLPTAEDGMVQFSDLEKSLSENKKSKTSSNVMDKIRNKHEAAPNQKQLVDEQTRQIPPEDVAKSVVAEMRDAVGEEKLAVLLDAARTLPKDVFNKILHMRRTNNQNLIAWSKVNTLFDKLAGGNEKISSHMSMSTKADAIWEAVNNGEAVNPKQLFETTEPYDSIRVFENMDMVDTGVSTDRFVAVDTIANSVHGSSFSIARSASEILKRLKESSGDVEITMTDGITTTTKKVNVKDLESYLNTLREETGVANMERVTEGETPIITEVKEKVERQHFTSLNKAWEGMKKLYGETDRTQLANQADELLSAAKSPEDMSDIIDGLREYAGDNAEMNALLDTAKDSGTELAARREALKKASFCIMGK